MASRRFRSYRITIDFEAPLPFVYAWCTDYGPEDARLAGEDRAIGLERRIVARTARRVVFENLYDEGPGWGWERHTVTLRPPDRWHSDGLGNYQEAHLDYRLIGLPGGRTRLEMRWRSRPAGLARGRRASRATIERFVRDLWRLRRSVLERAYRRSRPAVRSASRRGTNVIGPPGPAGP